MYRVVFIFALFLHYMCIIRALPTYGLVIREKFRSSKKGFRSTVRSSRTSYSFRSLHSSCAQKNHLPQKVANRVFTQSLHFAYSAAFIPVQNLLYQLHSVPSFTHCLHILESSHAGIVQAEQEAMQAPSAQSLRASASQ